MTTPYLSVVFSFRNEEEVLPELVRRTREALARQEKEGIVSGHELIFVNDASSDGSLAVLKELAAAQNDIRIITTSRPFGVAPCILAGMERSRGDLLVYMDADLQDPPEVIPQLLRAWREEEDVDVVHTVRTSRQGESLLRKGMTRLGYMLLFKTADIVYPGEDAGDFKLLSRRVVDHLVGMKERTPFVRGLVCWIGFKQTVVRYERQPRAAGKSKFPVLSRPVLWNFLDAALISFSSLPLKLAFFAGAVVSAVALVIFIAVLFQKIFTPWAVADVSLTLLVLVLLGGMQLLAVGIIGLYIYSIFLDTKARPNYIVKETFGWEKE